jgi:hypothetical protein
MTTKNAAMLNAEREFKSTLIETLCETAHGFNLIKLKAMCEEYGFTSEQLGQLTWEAIFQAKNLTF